jgi:3-deoxy-D-manno-octulosonic-acid transferase
VGARSEEDAERFVELGAIPERVCVTGDLKLASRATETELDPALGRVLDEAEIFVAGSTHAGEEAAAVAALARCEAAKIPLALVVAPRRLDRVNAVERSLRATGRRVLRRSSIKDEVMAPGDVLILDSLGELPSLYHRAVAAFVGGTFAPVGGHNLLEPMAAGCPVFFGPEIANVRESASLAKGSGAGESVASADELGAALVAMLGDPERLRQRQLAGPAALAPHAETTAHTLDLLIRVLGSNASDPVSRGAAR